MINFGGKVKKYYKYFFSFGSIALGIVVALVLVLYRPKVDSIHYYYDMTTEAEKVAVTFPFHQEIDLMGSTPSVITFGLGEDNINKYQYTITITNPETGKTLFSREFEDFDSSAYAIALAEPTKSGTEKLTVDIECEECKNLKFAMYKVNDEYTLGYVGTSTSINKWIIIYSGLFFLIGGFLIYIYRGEKNAKK